MATSYPAASAATAYSDAMPRRLASALDLVDLTPEEVEQFFATEDPERIVALVHDLDDRQVGRLVAAPHVRESAVRLVLARLGEFALPEALAAVKGVVAFEVDVPKGEAERHLLVFDGSGVEVCPPGDTDPDVTVSTAALDFVRLVSGGSNAAILLLGGRLRVSGDEELALRVGGVFQVPGRPGVAVDPAAVDPGEAAVAIKGVPDATLDRVMSGGFREVVLDQIVTRMPEFLDERKARQHRLTVGFRIDGRPDGGSDRVVLSVDRGTCRAERDTDGERDATLLLDGTQFLKLVLGHLNPVTAVMRGSIKVKGDVNAALRLHRLMRVPGS
jgi:putative sterol carrier protein